MQCALKWQTRHRVNMKLKKAAEGTVVCVGSALVLLSLLILLVSPRFVFSYHHVIHDSEIRTRFEEAPLGVRLGISALWGTTTQSGAPFPRFFRDRALFNNAIAALEYEIAEYGYFEPVTGRDRAAILYGLYEYCALWERAESLFEKILAEEETDSPRYRMAKELQPIVRRELGRSLFYQYLGEGRRILRWALREHGRVLVAMGLMTGSALLVCVSMGTQSVPVGVLTYVFRLRNKGTSERTIVMCRALLLGTLSVTFILGALLLITKW